MAGTNVYNKKHSSKIIEIRPFIFFFLYNNACSIHCARQVEMNREKLVKSQGRQ